jgi:hypothetical protein
VREDENVIVTEEDRVIGDRADRGDEPPFAWEWRVLAVSAVFAAPGLILGGLIGLVSGLGGPGEWWLAGGAVLGATFGGLLEAGHVLG